MQNVLGRLNLSWFGDFLKSHPTRCWFLLFFAIGLLFAQSGSSNGDIRAVTLFSMVEDKSFQLDPYYTLSIDWSRTPDGHYYSSKAPGPILLGYPLYWVLDHLITVGATTRAQRDARRVLLKGTTIPLVCFALTMIPLAIVAAYWILVLSQMQISLFALHLTAVLLLFGNTTCVFMNCFFSHGLTGAYALILAAVLYQRKFFWVGTLFGWLVLSDYSSVLFLLPLLWCTHSMQTRLKDYFYIGLGGFLPLLLFAWYHWVCFGGPFELSYKYVNPYFVEEGRPKFWGLIAQPDPEIWFQFLLGSARGIVWTQPWLLIGLAIAPFHFATDRKTQSEKGRVGSLLFRLNFPTLFLLILLFSAYGNLWHGGDSPGPRFISAAFPGLALLFGLNFDRFSVLLKRFSLAGVFVAVFFFITVFGALKAPDDAGPIWIFYYKRYFEVVPWTTWARFFILLFLFGFTLKKSQLLGLLKRAVRL